MIEVFGKVYSLNDLIQELGLNLFLIITIISFCWLIFYLIRRHFKDREIKKKISIMLNESRH